MGVRFRVVAARKKKKKVSKFSSHQYVEEEILDGNGKKVGTIRIKPSGVLWKPAGKRKFFGVTTAKFEAWITDPVTGAKRQEK